MEDRSPSSSNTAEKGDSQGQKQAACLNCRRSKTRCLRNAGDLKCKKCSQAQTECIIPDYRVGRKKGIKNKRDGLSKAVFAIEQAIKKSRTKSTQSEEDRNTFHLQHLLNEAQGLLPQRPTSAGSVRSAGHLPQQEINETVPESSAEEQFAVDDAENPLQLLARASDLSAPNAQTSFATSASIHHNPSRAGNDQDLQDFFGPFRPSLDVGPDIDPIDLGLVTEEEAIALFAYFYDNLSHTRWGLDAKLHTPDFVRKRSSFLFASIMAASALFIPTAAAISKRLSSHCKHLAQSIMVKRHRSPEIVLGFMVNIPWMAPGKHWADDETCSYMGAALTIAIDISLNKLIVPSPSPSLKGIHERRPPSDYISARKALDLDGFHDVDPASEFGRRLLRRRERIWLALFVLDRGVCLARGRGFTVPLTPIIEHCDNWHQSDIADVWDGSMVSSAMLRRDLEVLISDVKKTCDGNGIRVMNGDNTAQSLQHMIDGFFTKWYTTWAFATGGMKDNSIPPYVEILVTHGRLSIYSSVINHPTAPVEVKRFFRAAGLSSALNVMRAAVQGENRLKSMPNNTAIMISFAACFAFYLSTMGSAANISLAPSIRKLIEETAALLERIGSNPPHRNGTSALYGRHLREVVGSFPARPDGLSQPLQQTSFPISRNVPIQPQLPTYQNQAAFAPIQMSELLPFSAMSDDQINEAINNAGDELEMYLPSFQMADNRLDWLDSMDWFNMDAGMNLGQ
ncbi:uncharacterized protein LY89DRAFT_313584 [Mollisia scopiformis]|uniref:Zn(2)-C6 fungal-type domain-containing protein n=1 Tax=Mollisia scopiformis TaxID=149040 RepID=A0A194XRX5_MOLSC|nr:uncharacterized protein LY89DRAFT_313584 [Mollisia scopiformis]KUJ22901.1 hypothetical protein LY89DRAFT_313584 [Mollisia scopiformis]